MEPHAAVATETVEHPRFGRIAVRPVRADDAPAIRAAFAHQLPADIRTRFFGAMDALPPDMLAHMVRFAPGDEVTFVAEAPDGTLLGGVRLVGERGGEDAEFAITIASHAKGAGLGRLLMERMLRYARTLPLARIGCDILHGNLPMLRLARSLGFRLADLSESAEIVRATLTLR